jgi:hypothetical protein
MELEAGKKRPGSNVDSWCGKCKMMLAHTVEAMVGDKPARVHCNTCKSQHSYRPNPPGSGATRQPRKREPGSGPGRVTRYQSLLKNKDTAGAKSYSVKDRYELGDVLEHPIFGYGVATAVKDGNKIEVLFESGSKVLIHGR